MKPLAWIPSLFVLLWASQAWAYPHFIAKGYTNCGTCHYGATGGGLLNSYGVATLEATFPDDVESGAFTSLRESLAKADVTGRDEQGEAAFQLDGGLDVRLLLLSTEREVKGERELLLVPMLAEVGAVAAYGPTLVYATATPRRTGPERMPDQLFSREHWFQVRFSDATVVRAGRMVLPFGLRLADHTQYVREDFGFDKWDQSYALEVDSSNERWMLSAAAFAGDLWLDPTRLQERGGVASFAYNIPSKASIGLSLLGAKSEATIRAGGSVHARWQPFGGAYLLAEGAGQQLLSSGATDDAQFTLAGYLRPGWFVLKSLDLFFELGARAVLGFEKLTKLRYGLGASWQIIPWIELTPQALLEEDIETGLKASWLVQLHVVY